MKDDLKKDTNKTSSEGLDIAWIIFPALVLIFIVPFAMIDWEAKRERIDENYRKWNEFSSSCSKENGTLLKDTRGNPVCLPASAQARTLNLYTEPGGR